MYCYQTYIQTTEELLNTFSQKEIFKIIFKEYPEIGKYYTSPFREDDNGDCYFTWYNNLLWFVDWADKNRNCIQAIKDYYNLNNLRNIIDFITININNLSLEKPEYNSKTIKKQKEQSIIVPLKREYELKDILFWKRFGISKEQLEEDLVFPIKAINILKKEWIRYNYDDESYCITLAKNTYKIYRPFQKGKLKWLSNGNQNIINGITNSNSDKLIITKSYKDCRVLRNFNYDSIWFQSENTIPDDFILESFVKNYKNITILYDNDRAGIIGAQKLNKKLSLVTHNIKVKTIYSDVTYIKDISEMYCYLGESYTFNFLKNYS
jgi:hypothetical protein